MKHILKYIITYFEPLKLRVVDQLFLRFFQSLSLLRKRLLNFLPFESFSWCFSRLYRLLPVQVYRKDVFSHQTLENASAEIASER